jgi:hypothetical protein
LEIPLLLWSTPSRLIAAFGLPSLQPPTPSLCWVWRGGFSPTLPRDMACVVLIQSFYLSFKNSICISPKKETITNCIKYPSEINIRIVDNLLTLSLYVFSLRWNTGQMLQKCMWAWCCVQL